MAMATSLIILKKSKICYRVIGDVFNFDHLLNRPETAEYFFDIPVISS